MTVAEYSKYIDDNILIDIAKEESDNLDFVYRAKYHCTMEDTLTEQLLLNLEELGISLLELDEKEVASIYHLQSDYDNYLDIESNMDTVTIYTEDEAEATLVDYAEYTLEDTLTSVTRYIHKYIDEESYIEDYVDNTNFSDIQDVKDEIIINDTVYYIVKI